MTESVTASTFSQAESALRQTIASAPPGVDALALARMLTASGTCRWLHVALDDTQAARLVDCLAFFAPEVEAMVFPAWDCLPYDRVSPNGEIVSRRVEALAELAAVPADRGPLVVLTTVNAILQRVPPRAFFDGASLTLRVGEEMPLGRLLDMFARSGYGRSDTVREPGEYAVRGGIVDVFPTGMDEPVRFFGDELEAARRFDAMTQRTTGKVERVVFRPVGETLLDEGTIQRFRSAYRARFGAEVSADPVYEAVTAGQRYAGMEHWLPLFHDRMETLLDYVGEAPVTLDHQVEEAAATRFDQIAEYQDARRQMLRSGGVESGGIYRPLPTDALYLTAEEWSALLADLPVGGITPFAAPPGAAVIDLGAVGGLDLAEARTRGGSAVYDAARDAIAAETAAGRRVIVAGYSEGSRDRLASLLRDHGVEPIEPVENLAEVSALPPGTVAAAVLPLERGWCARRGAGGAAARSSCRRSARSRPATTWSMPSTASASMSGWRRWRSAARRMTACGWSTPAATSCSCRSRTSTCCRATARRTATPSSTVSEGPPGRPARRGSRSGCATWPRV